MYVNLYLNTGNHTLLTWLTLSYKASLQVSHGKKKKETYKRNLLTDIVCGKIVKIMKLLKIEIIIDRIQTSDSLHSFVTTSTGPSAWYFGEGKKIFRACKIPWVAAIPIRCPLTTEHRGCVVSTVFRVISHCCEQKSKAETEVSFKVIKL